MLKTILSVSGKPGLYRLLSQGKNNLIVESLQTGQRIPIHPKDRVVSLGDISMFTDAGSLGGTHSCTPATGRSTIRR